MSISESLRNRITYTLERVNRIGPTYPQNPLEVLVFIHPGDPEVCWCGRDVDKNASRMVQMSISESLRNRIAYTYERVNRIGSTYPQSPLEVLVFSHFGDPEICWYVFSFCSSVFRVGHERRLEKFAIDVRCEGLKLDR